MFTGIVETVGEVGAVIETTDGKTLAIESGLTEGLTVGGSLAVNGVCLTATEVTAGVVSLDVIPETLERTNLGELEVGSRVNLERPMSADGRFDGHIVQGHVDGTGVISSLSSDEKGTLMAIAPQAGLERYIVEKGSITVDGVSLTIAGLDEATFTVALIPHTLDVTILGLRNEGEVVNLEVDVLAKYVERLLGRA